ncbi:MAG: TIM-barrel domain-containing protein [bacterium]
MKPGKVVGCNRVAGGCEFRCENAVASVTFAGKGVVRVRAAPGEGFEPDFSWAVVRNEPSGGTFSVERTRERVVLKAREVSVAVEMKPFHVSFYGPGGTLLNSDAEGGGVSWSGRKIRCRKEMPADERYFGFGEKAFHLDRRGKRMVNWNTDAALHTWNSDPLYQSIPFFIGVGRGRAYGIFFDNSWKSFFDMGASSRRYYTFGAEGGEMNYYFIHAPGAKEILERYTWLTGRMPLPPLWALGYHQSRYSYKDEGSVRRVAARMRALGFPCDVIHLDIHYMDDFRVFTWHPERFPRPEKLLTELRAGGFRVVTIVDPGVKRDTGYRVFREGLESGYFLKKRDGTLFYGYVWPGETAFPDFSRADVRRWWGEQHRELTGRGVAGIWNDMNEPSENIKPHARRVSTRRVVHYDGGRYTPHAKNRNVYGLQECRATREGLLRLRPDERPFVLTRAGYAGIQRYAAAWTGDNSSTFRHLRLSIPMLLNMGLSGAPFVGADIGGFTGNCSPELYARWVQLGAFYPFCRTHTAILSRPQEPWSFGRRVAGIARKYISLRYRLLPYIYTLFREAAWTGTPVLRALFMEFPWDEACVGIEDELMVGSSILLAPVLKRGARRRRVYLPAGADWVDFETLERRAGGVTITADAPLHRMPIFVRAGAIIPTQAHVRCADEITMNPLVVEVYPAAFNAAGGGRSVFTLYEDDGATMKYEEGVFCTTAMECRRRRGGVRFTLHRRKGVYHPGARVCELVFRGVDKPLEVRLNGEPLEEETGGADGAGEGRWWYEREGKVLRAAFTDRGERVDVDAGFRG